MEMKILESVKDFENKIRRWAPDGGDCKLYKDFVSNLGYVIDVNKLFTLN